MTYKIERKNGTVELTAKELEDIYWAMRKEHMADWMETLLKEYGYKEQTKDKRLDMAEMYMERMCCGDKLGEAEHDAFDCMMEEDYPEIEYEEEE